MKKFFIAVIALAILLIAGYGIAYFVSPVKTAALEEYGHEIGISCKQAYIVRNETVYYAAAEGTIYNSVSEGDRVSRDMPVSTIFNGSVDGASLRELRALDDDIARLGAMDGGTAAADSATTENEISGKMDSIPELSRRNDIETIHSYKNDINRLRSGAELNEETELETLTAQRAECESRISTGKNEIISDRSGIFSTYVDGLETVLSPDSVQGFSAADIRQLQSGSSHRETGDLIAAGDPVCKIMNNHIWYVLGITDSEHAAVLGSVERVTVRFTEFSGAGAKGTVEYVSEPDENGECVYLIQIPSYVDIAFSYRVIAADIIIEEYDGYKVPTESIRTGDTMNEYYVYAIRGSDTYKCRCEILYTDPTEGFSIIQSSEEAEAKLSSMDRLIVGER